MRTDELIDVLAADANPVARGAVRRSLMMALAGAAVVSLLILLWWLGMRDDIHIAMRTLRFWMKALYTSALALSGFWLTLRLSRPDGRVGRGWVFPLAVVGVLAGLAVVELATTPPAGWRGLLMGHSWRQCPVRILAISTPIFMVVLWTLRRLAPTRLMLAGAAAGLLSGGVGATLYGLACDERAAAFTVVWYTLAIGVSTLVGALTGPRLLAWR
jgi:hypothetical protein